MVQDEAVLPDRVDSVLVRSTSHENQLAPFHLKTALIVGRHAVINKYHDVHNGECGIHRNNFGVRTSCGSAWRDLDLAVLGGT